MALFQNAHCESEELMSVKFIVTNKSVPKMRLIRNVIHIYIYIKKKVNYSHNY